MPRLAVLFSYDGTRFDSFARQPGRRTVEGELLRALRRSGMIASSRTARYAVASRTDRGVSAWENVFAVDSRAHPQALLHRTRTPEGLLLRGAVSVGDDFSPRQAAVSRTYEYAVGATPGLDRARLARACSFVEGRHDFSNFRRPDAGADPVRVLRRARVLGTGPRLRIQFEAGAFLWEQVRRLTHGLVAVARHERTFSSLRAQLACRAGTRPEPPVDPEPLLLTRVNVGLSFPFPTRSQRDAWEALAVAHRRRADFYAGVLTRGPTVRR